MRNLDEAYQILCSTESCSLRYYSVLSEIKVLYFLVCSPYHSIPQVWLIWLKVIITIIIIILPTSIHSSFCVTSLHNAIMSFTLNYQTSYSDRIKKLSKAWQSG